MSAVLWRLVLRVRDSIWPTVREEDLEREVDSHLALLEDEYRSRGYSDDLARRAAAKRFGSVALAKTYHRDERVIPWLDDARQDLGLAARNIRRRPAAPAAAVLLVGLAVAGTTTLASLVYGVLYRPLPWPDGHALIRVEEARGGQRGRIPWTMSNATYREWAERHDTVETIGGWVARTVRLSLGDDVQPLPAVAITPSMMQVLRVSPLLGRAFDDGPPGTVQQSHVLLSYGLWERGFGRRPSIVGESLRIDGSPYTVVGVMPRSFAFPDRTAQLWLPMSVPPVLGDGGVRRVMIFSVLARLRDGVSVSQAATEATARARQAPGLAQAALSLFGDGGEITVAAASAQEVVTREVRPGLSLLAAAVGLLLVAALASLAHLQVARALERRREFALRAALGAGVTRLGRQWIAESMLFGAAGGSAGLVLAAGLHKLLPLVMPPEFPRLADVRLDIGIVVAAALGTIGVSAVSGILPAWLARNEAIAEVLTHDAPATLGGSHRTRVARLRTAMLAAQVAVACVLLVGTAQLSQSLLNLQKVDRGYDPHDLLTARVILPGGATFSRIAPTVDQVHERLLGSPGVVAVAFGNALPFVTSGGFRGFTIPSPLDPSRPVDIQTATRVVTPSYFPALGLRIVEGRPIDDTDSQTARPVVVVNRTFEERYLGGDAIGQRLALRIDGRDEWEVVGVVADMKQGSTGLSPSAAFGGVTDPPLPELFFSASQWQQTLGEMVVVVRTTQDPSASAAVLRSAFREATPRLALDSVTSMEERVANSLALPRLYAVIVAGLGLLALGVAGVGIYGVLATATAKQTREIGLRSALGAAPTAIVRLVLGNVAPSVFIGLGVGFGIAAAVTKVVSARLYGVSSTDPRGFATAFIVLTVGAGAASVAPLVRALRTRPLDALRSE